MLANFFSRLTSGFAKKSVLDRMKKENSSKYGTSVHRAQKLSKYVFLLFIGLLMIAPILAWLDDYSIPGLAYYRLE